MSLFRASKEELLKAIGGASWLEGEDADEFRHLLAEHSGIQARAQAFFQSYADESRKPHCSDRDKGWIANLLLRAEEAGLYKSGAK